MPALSNINQVGALTVDDQNILNNNFANCFLLNRGATQRLNDLFTEYAQDGITAHAGGGQAAAYQLVAQMNRVTTAASAGDSVQLPPSVPGLEVLVINHSATLNPIQVFGNGTDTINDIASATGVTQMSNSAVIYACTTAGAWYTIDLAIGYYQGFQTTSYLNGITAHAGGGQASATPLTAMLNRVTTVATAADSVLLPVTTQPGLVIYVANTTANSMNVFPSGTDTINGGAASAAFAVAAGKTAQFICASTGAWHAILSA